MPLSPKADFATKPDFVKAHLNLVDSPELRAAVDATLLQLLSTAGDTSDPIVAAAVYHRIMGARQFVNQFLTLADKAKAPETPLSFGQLNHNV